MYHFTMDLEIYDPIKDNMKFWDDYFERTYKIADEIFTSLNRNDVTITCFVTNDFIQNYHDLFHSKVVKYHEIGCHTDTHYYYKRNNKGSFLSSIKKNKAYIEKDIGERCLGFRSPGGLLPKDLVKHLTDFGFIYDSSVLPGIIPGRKFKINTPRRIYHPSKKNIYMEDSTQNDFFEIPLSVSPVLKFSRNGLFFPYLFNLENAMESGEPVVTYIHLSDLIKTRGYSYIWDNLKRDKKSREIIKNFIEKAQGLDLRLCKVIS